MQQIRLKGWHISRVGRSPWFKLVEKWLNIIILVTIHLNGSIWIGPTSLTNLHQLFILMGSTDVKSCFVITYIFRTSDHGLKEIVSWTLTTRIVETRLWKPKIKIQCLSPHNSLGGDIVMPPCVCGWTSQGASGTLFLVFTIDYNFCLITSNLHAQIVYN